MRLFSLPVLLVILGAAAALGIVHTVEPQEVPRYTAVTPPNETRIACQTVSDGQLLASGQGPVAAFPHGEEPGERADQVQVPASGLMSVHGLAPSGGILSDVWAPCQAPTSSGFVLLPDAKKAELRLANPDASPASVDLSLYGPDGEVLALGAHGINLTAGEMRPVALSVLAKDIDGPVAVAWRTTKGRVVATGVTTGTVTHVAPSAPAGTRLVLPGQGKGGKPTIVIANPTQDRVAATVQFHSPTSTFTPAGGEDLSIPAKSVVAVDLAEGAGGEAGAFTVESDEEITATLYSGTGEVRGVGVATDPDLTLSGAVPGGSTLLLTNVGDTLATASVGLADAANAVMIQPGTTAEVPVGDGALIPVTVDADQPLVGAAVTSEGKAVIPLHSTTGVAVEPINAELVPTLR